MTDEPTTTDAEKLPVHIVLDGATAQYVCKHCGGREDAPIPGRVRRVIDVGKYFAEQHAGCRPSDSLPPVPTPGDETPTVTGTVFQVWYLPPEGEWHLWKSVKAKVGAARFWGHESRGDALRWIACLSDEYDGYALQIRPMEVTVTTTYQDAARISPSGAVAELRAGKEVAQTSTRPPAEYVEVFGGIEGTNADEWRCTVCGNRWAAPRLTMCDACGGIERTPPPPSEYHTSGVRLPGPATKSGPGVSDH